jgi:2-polyprenyl-6-methoxyphenol hydroxylase-like FAD-dependent oxidoreductase
VTLKVLVVGAGVGGLALAQGLRKAGVDVRVFERDRSSVTRGQGYRLRIDAHGIAALRSCLPGDLFRLFVATTNAPYLPRGAVFDHHLNQTESWAEHSDPARPSTVANRRTLRQVLLAGLGDAVAFGQEVQAVTDTGDGVVVRLADGDRAWGDVLVAADGINSTVRGQLLPHAELIDTGLRGIYGHAILDAELGKVLPAALYGGSSPVLGPDGVTMAVGVFQPRQSPQRAAAEIAPYARLDHVCDYVKWTLVAPPHAFGLTEDEVWHTAPERLYAIAEALTADWHPALVELVRLSDPSSTFPLSIRAAATVDPWPTSRITYLGDAIHATTPVGGTGANTALRDAALLAHHLTEADRGRIDLLASIGTSLTVSRSSASNLSRALSHQSPTARPP